MFKDKLTFGYILFVGIPLLILIGTLRAGAHLSAPPAVSGEWTIDPQPSKCAAPRADAGPPGMTIYQTGVDLLIALNDPPKTTLAGHVANGRVDALSTATGCGPVVRLDADLIGKPGRRSLQGRLWFDGCNACAPVAFHAVKSGK
jgi:hypothetical protein